MKIMKHTRLKKIKWLKMNKKISANMSLNGMCISIFKYLCVAKKKSDDIKRKISSLVQNTYAYPN